MDQRNLLLAFALSMVVLLGWQQFFPQQEPAQNQAQTESAAPLEQKTATAGDTYAQPPTMPDAEELSTTQSNPSAVPVASEHVESGQVFTLGNDLINLKVNDKGWIIKGTLVKYVESIEPGSANIDVLFMNDKGHSVYANSGVIGSKKPSTFTLVKQDAASLTIQARLDQEKIWKRTFSLKAGSYKIEILDEISNGQGLKMYRQVVERNPNKKLNTFMNIWGRLRCLTKNWSSRIMMIWLKRVQNGCLRWVAGRRS